MILRTAATALHRALLLLAWWWCVHNAGAETVDPELGETEELGLTREFLETSRILNLIPSLPISVPDSKDEQCRSESLLLETHLSNKTLWAFQMWDASEKHGVGLSSGNRYQLGDFDECVAVTKPIVAQYCLVEIFLKVSQEYNTEDPFARSYDPFISTWSKLYYGGAPIKQKLNEIRWALCLPASCTAEDVSKHLNEFLRLNNRTELTVSVSPRLCTTLDRPADKIQVEDIVFLSLAVFLVILAIVGTALDFVVFRDIENWDWNIESRLTNCIMCFSMRRALQSLTSRGSVIKGLDFAPLNGMTAMSMLLIIIGHRWSFRLPGPLQNYEENESVYYEYLISIFTSHVDLLVDTFFTVSGLLMVYIILDRLSSQSISFWKIVFFRYIRLTPVYAAVIFFAATWWYKLGSGPMWESLVGLDRANCRTHWWVNLLYLNNYIHPNDSCGFHTWFMPCEFHFSTAIIPVIFLLKRRPKRGIVLLLVALCASIVIPFCITYIGNKPPNLQFNFKFSLNPAEDEYYQSLYTKSHTRAGPYIVGALLGYVLYKHDSKKLSLKSTWLHGLFGGVVMMVAWFTGAIYYDPTYKYSVLESALYGSSVRTIWGIGLSILIYSLVVGTHTIVHSILSWKPFTLLSGLAFNAYLVNCIFPVSSTASRRAGDHFSVMNFLTEATADVVFSLSCGFVLYLLVERPFRLLFTLLLSNVQRKEEEKLSTENKQEGSIHKF